MARIPTLEDTLLEIRKSLGLKRVQTKTQKSFRSLQTDLDDHMNTLEVFLLDVFAALELDEQAQADARGNLLEWIGFHHAVELNTWTAAASPQQVLWHLLAYSYVPALARRLAFWVLNGARRGQPVDTGMPGGKFWYLPEWDRERNRIHLPVQQVMDWLFDLVGDQGKERAFSGLARERDGKRINDHALRTLQNWRLNRTPPDSATQIDELFHDDSKITFQGTYPTEACGDEYRLASVQSFLKQKELTPKKLADEIPMDADAIQAVLDCKAPADQLQLLHNLLCTRYAAPSMRTIRLRLRIARMAQNGYERILAKLCGSEVAPSCTDPAQNKVLQLLALFHTVYNLTLQAEKSAATPEEADAWFDQRLTPWEKADMMLSIAPSMRPEAHERLAERLTRIFLEQTADSPIHDLVPTQETDAKSVIAHRLMLLKRHAEEDLRLEALLKAETEDQLLHLIRDERSPWVIRQLLRYASLPDPSRRVAIEQLKPIACTGVQSAEIPLIEMEYLLEMPPAQCPEDVQERMEALLETAWGHPGHEHWEAPLHRLQALHRLRQNRLDEALEDFKQARAACMKANYGDLRLRIAREGFATAVAMHGMSNKHHVRFYGDWMRYGPFVIGMPAPQDLAPEAEEYFRDVLHVPYPGVADQISKEVARRADAVKSLLRLTMAGDTAGLDAWLKANAKLYRKTYFEDARRDSLLLRMLKLLSGFEKPAIAVPSEPQIAHTVSTIRTCIVGLVTAWPEQADMADFKGQTPLMLVADAGDVHLTTLLAKQSDVDQQDYMGRTAFHAAVASRSPPCVAAILDSNPNTLLVTKDEGNTALHTAVRFGQPECVRLIVDEYPGLVSHPNAQGLTPSDLAQDILTNHQAWQIHMARANRATGSNTDFEAILALLRSSAQTEATSPATSAPA